MKGKIRAELEKYRIDLDRNPFTKSGKEKSGRDSKSPVSDIIKNKDKLLIFEERQKISRSFYWKKNGGMIRDEFKRK